VTNTIAPENVGAVAVELNARQVGALMTGKSAANGTGLIVAPTVTRKALERRGLVDAAGCWTELGRAVVAHLDNPPTTDQRVAAAGAARAEQILDALAATVAAPGSMVPASVDDRIAGLLADAGLTFRGRITNRGIEKLTAARGEDTVRTLVREATANAAENAPHGDDRIAFEYLNADTRLHRETGVEIRRIEHVWHVAVPGREPYTGGNRDTEIDNIMQTAHTAVRAVRIERAAAARGVQPHELTDDQRAAAARGEALAPSAAEVAEALAELGLVMVTGGHYTSDAGVIVEQHGDRTWWAYAPKPGTSERKVLCSGQTTLAACLPYVAEWVEQLDDDHELALRCNGVTFAEINPGTGAHGDGIGTDASLTIEGIEHLVPNRSQRGGTMAAHRLGETLAASGYQLDGKSFRDAMPAPHIIRVRLAEFEPVLDADGNRFPLPLLRPDTDVEIARRLAAGWVPAPGCPHYMAKSERTAGFTTCEQAACVATRGTGTELVVMPGDDRQVDQDAAARCSAVLAGPKTHGGKVEPYLFTDGPLGEHVEQLCEIHGACTTARHLSAVQLADWLRERELDRADQLAAAGEQRADVEAAGALVGEVLDDRPPVVQLLSDERNGHAVVIRPAGAQAAAAGDDEPTEREQVAAAFGPVVEQLAIAAGGAPAEPALRWYLVVARTTTPIDFPDQVTAWAGAARLAQRRGGREVMIMCRPVGAPADAGGKLVAIAGTDGTVREVTAARSNEDDVHHGCADNYNTACGEVTGKVRLMTTRDDDVTCEACKAKRAKTFAEGDDVLDPDGRRAQVYKLTTIKINGEQHRLALIDYFDGDDLADPTPYLVAELRPAPPRPQAEGDPIIVVAHVEDMSARSGRYEIERAAWEAWPPARRRREVANIGDEEVSSAGGYGASVDGE
jgi:hypothetical protein